MGINMAIRTFSLCAFIIGCGYGIAHNQQVGAYCMGIATYMYLLGSEKV